MMVRVFGGGGMQILEVDSGTKAADGTEQSLVDESSKGLYEGTIDLTNMAAGDTLVIGTYTKIISGGSYVQNGLEVLVGAQTVPSIFVLRRSVLYGFKLTIQQTGGTNRNYPFNVTKQS